MADHLNKKAPGRIRGLVCAMALFATSASAQQVTISAPHLGCQSYEAFEKIYAFVHAKQSAMGDQFIKQQVMSRRCRFLKEPVAMIKRGWQYSRVIDSNGDEWYVIAQSVD
jgi:hypothetical protein